MSILDSGHGTVTTRPALECVRCGIDLPDTAWWGYYLNDEGVPYSTVGPVCDRHFGLEARRPDPDPAIRAIIEMAGTGGPRRFTRTWAACTNCGHEDRHDWHELGECSWCGCTDYTPTTCQCGRVLHAGYGRRWCSDSCSKRARRARRREYLARSFEINPELAADVFPEEAWRRLPRTCIREGCDNPLTGRRDRKFCSGACRIAAKRERDHVTADN